MKTDQTVMADLSFNGVHICDFVGFVVFWFILISVLFQYEYGEEPPTE